MASDWRTAPAPAGWGYCRLVDLVDLPQGQVDPRREPYRSMVLVAPDHVESNTGCLLAKETAAQQGAISGKYTFGPDTIVYSKIRPYLRKAILADFDGLCSADMYPLRPRAGLADAGFLFVVVLGEHYSRFAEIVSMRTGIPKINRQELAEYVVARPSLREQRRIAEILDTLNKAIVKTEQLVAKLKQVKQGLLHDLLTRGIDENGEIRDPERHPQQFKESPVGRLPVGWTVHTLRDCLVASPANGIYKPASAIGNGTLLVGQTSFTEDRTIDFALARRARVTDAELRRHGLEQGDVLISRVFATLNGVGQPALVPELPEAAVFESNMMRLRVDRAAIDPMLFFMYLRSHPVRQKLTAVANLSNQASINQHALNALPLGLPPIEEQSRILSSIVAIVERERSESKSLQKLRLLKQGLMDDLLTGRVRVTPLLEESTP